MEQEENTLDTQEVQQESESTGAAEEVVTEQTDTEVVEETAEAKLAKAQAEAAKYRRLLEKAQKPQAPQTPTNVEETVLLANGMSEDLMEKLKAVAAVQKTSLIKAQNDPIFVAVKNQFEKEQKQQAASLPASRGAGAVRASKTFNSPGLSRDEHRKMVLGG